MMHARNNGRLATWLMASGIGWLFSMSVLRADDVDLVIGTEPEFRLRVTLISEEAKWADRFQKIQERYHELLFDRLDADGDGKLTPAEAKRTPPPLYRWKNSTTGGINETHLAFNFLVLDDDRDGFISRDELKAFYADYEAGPVSVSLWNRPGQPEGRTTVLFQLLDHNKDAFLDAGELESAAKLWQLDRDADELLTLVELRPASAISERGEFIAPEMPYKLQPVANYSIRHAIVSDDPPAADAHLTFRLPPGQASQFELVPSKPGTFPEMVGGRIVIRQQGIQLEFLVEPTSLRVLEQTRQVLRREVASLPGEKKITDEVDFPVFLRDHAALIDADGDGKLTGVELETYLAELLPARMLAESGRIVFRRSATVSGLFAYLDQDHDGRLSKHELSNLKTALTELDKNGDKKLSQAEIPPIVRIVLASEAAPPPYLFAEQRNAGPPWFYRLDKNQDGTLTPAEFPGRQDLFTELDQDQNQILSLEEALDADEKFRQAGIQEN